MSASAGGCLIDHVVSESLVIRLPPQLIDAPPEALRLVREAKVRIERQECLVSRTQSLSFIPTPDGVQVHERWERPAQSRHWFTMPLQQWTLWVTAILHEFARTPQPTNVPSPDDTWEDVHTVANDLSIAFEIPCAHGTASLLEGGATERSKKVLALLTALFEDHGVADWLSGHPTSVQPTQPVAIIDDEPRTLRTAALPFRAPPALLEPTLNDVALRPGERGMFWLEGVGCESRPKESYDLVQGPRGVEARYSSPDQLVFTISPERWHGWVIELMDELRRTPTTRAQALGLTASEPVPSRPWSTAGTGHVELQLPFACGTLTYREGGGMTDRPVRVLRSVGRLFADHGVNFDPELEMIALIDDDES